jgi:hypothetical protein
MRSEARSILAGVSNVKVMQCCTSLIVVQVCQGAAHDIVVDGMNIGQWKFQEDSFMTALFWYCRGV